MLSDGLFLEGLAHAMPVATFDRMRVEAHLTAIRGKSQVLERRSGTAGMRHLGDPPSLGVEVRCPEVKGGHLSKT
jgi:hypothetical protein